MKHQEALELKPFSFGRAGGCSSPEPEQRLALASTFDGDRVRHGVWECGPGQFDLEFAWSETAFILGGRAEIENLVTGEKHELTAGTLAQFERGSKWRWRVPWKIKKVFTTLSPE